MVSIKQVLSMVIKSEWVTPITAGAFLLSAITGVLMFFHLDTGLNKMAHEWLSWTLLTGVILHLTINFSGFKRHIKTRQGQLLIGIFTLALLVSFMPAGNKDKPSFAIPIKALSQAPLTTLALVAQISPEQLHERLAKAGIVSLSNEQSLNELIGPDLRQQIHVLKTLLSKQK